MKSRLVGPFLFFRLCRIVPVFLLLVLHSRRTWAYEYDPGNFNPLQSSFEHSILCLAPLPFFPIPPKVGRPPIYTLQQLCAQPQYGGLPPGYHLGGFCMTLHGRGPGYMSENPSPKHAVGFEIADVARVDPDLSSPRLKLYCAQFCRCSGIIPAREERKDTFWDHEPESSWWSLEFGDHPNLPFYGTSANKIALDQSHFWPYRSYLAEYPPGYLVQTPRKAEVMESNYSIDQGQSRAGQSTVTYVSDPANMIVCNDSWKPPHISTPDYLSRYIEFPDFNPNDHRDFWKMPEIRMCANPFSWGEVEVPYSVGGICSRSEGQLDTVMDVEFSPEVIYHQPFQTSLLGAQLKIYCWHICRCIDDQMPGYRPSAEFWETWEKQVGQLTRQQGSDNVPPPPSFQSERTESGRPKKMRKTGDLQCGRWCTGNNACVAHNVGGRSCKCQVSGSTFAKVTTLGKVFTGATCMWVTSSAGAFQKPGLKGRDVGPEGPPCVCNASYVSYACCGAEELVFEDGDLRLGSLLV